MENVSAWRPGVKFLFVSLISIWNDIKHWLPSKQSEYMGSELWKGSFKEQIGLVFVPGFMQCLFQCISEFDIIAFETTPEMGHWDFHSVWKGCQVLQGLLSLSTCVCDLRLEGGADLAAVNSNVVEPWAVAHQNKINQSHCRPVVNVEAPDKMNSDCLSGDDDTL